MNQELKHEPALRRSECFSEFTVREFSTMMKRDIPSIIGYAYSLSTSPRSAFGSRATEFEEEIIRALLSLNPAGMFSERVDTEVIIARRHGAAKP